MTRRSLALAALALASVATLAALFAVLSRRPARAQLAVGDIDPSCRQSLDPIVLSGSTLDGATSAAREGVTFDGGELRLTNQIAGAPGPIALGLSDNLAMACAGDFNGDGWDDIVGADVNFGNLRLYQNRTFESPAGVPRTPKFITPTALVNPTYRIESNHAHSGMGTIACNDVNKDGHLDFILVRCDDGTECSTPNRAVIFRGRGNGTFETPISLIDGNNLLARLDLGGTRFAFLDHNGDGRKDLVAGVRTTALEGGRVVVYLNENDPSGDFDDDPVVLLTSAGFGDAGPNAIAVADFTGDALPDLAAGGVSAAFVRLYPGLSGGGFSPTYQTLPGFTGGALALLAGDFNNDGRVDLVASTDGDGAFPGFRTFAWVNDGDGTPFSAAPLQLGAPGGATDADFALAIDYDDNGLLDLIAGNANVPASYHVFTSTTGATYVECGTVATGDLDVGDLGDGEATITEVRLAPTPSAPAVSEGTVTWEASNDGGNNWVNATACTDEPTAFCAGFNTTSGTDIRWRARLCSPAGNADTPAITSVSTSFTYVASRNHYRAGPVADDGIVYVAAFQEPGSSGHLYAISEENPEEPLWDAGELLDDNVARKVFTVTADNELIEFSVAGAADARLQTLLGAADQAAAEAIVTWWLSARFGAADEQHVLGAIENSTPAVLGPPGLPIWYGLPDVPPTEKVKVATFVGANEARQPLVFVGAADGALHAFYTNPFNPADPLNGTEAWAFIPYDVATRLQADKNGSITAYPDGSPSLANVKIDEEWRTVLVTGEGHGGRSVFALDVTNTIEEGGSVAGPTPLWHFTDTDMGKTHSKPAIIRVFISDEERYLAVFASSGSGGAADIGDSVYAIDIASGDVSWRFEIGDTGSAITSDIAAAETDDETGTTLDGYVDRLFFGDNKGRVWKINPAAGGAVVNSSVSVGLAHSALFATSQTELGAERPIAGTIAIAPDPGGRLILYFGTGGTEGSANDVQNALYAVFADTGEVSLALDEEAEGIAEGMKFYGGIAFNDGQLLVTTGQDLSGLGLCAPSAGQILSIDAYTFAADAAPVDTGSKIMGPIFVRSGQVYAVTVEGKLQMPEEAGGPDGLGEGSGGGGSTPTPFSILGWHQVQ